MTKDKNYKDKYKRQNYIDKDKRGKVQQSTEATQPTRLARFVLDSCPQLWKVDSKKMLLPAASRSKKEPTTLLKKTIKCF